VVFSKIQCSKLPCLSVPASSQHLSISPSSSQHKQYKKVPAAVSESSKRKFRQQSIEAVQESPSNSQHKQYKKVPAAVNQSSTRNSGNAGKAFQVTTQLLWAMAYGHSARLPP